METIEINKETLKKDNQEIIIPYKIFIILLIIISIVSIGLGIFFYKKSTEMKTDNTEISNQQVRLIVNAVSKYVLLPDDEIPLLATVNDETKVKENPFLINAKTGDKILVYLKTGRAILYRPSEDRIINIESVYISSQSDTNTTPSVKPS